MKINLDIILEQKGKTRYWLAKEIGVTYPNLKKLADNNTTSIKFELIEKICKTLECTPTDIFIID